MGHSGLRSVIFSVVGELSSLTTLDKAYTSSGAWDCDPIPACGPKTRGEVVEAIRRLQVFEKDLAKKLDT